ncbi:MAG: hypothetical protein ACK4IX_10395, partial [Candidatus Sericytochromatia bacterium]
MILKSEKHEKQIIENLIEEGIVSNEQLSTLSKSQIREIEEVKKSFFRKTYLFDLEKGKIDVLNNNFERVSELIIEDSDVSFPSEQFRIWGNSIPVLDQSNAKVQSIKSDYKTFGISLSNADRAFVYKDYMFDDKFFSASYQVVF